MSHRVTGLHQEMCASFKNAKTVSHLPAAVLGFKGKDQLWTTADSFHALAAFWPNQEFEPDVVNQRTSWSIEILPTLQSINEKKNNICMISLV